MKIIVKDVIDINLFYFIMKKMYIGFYLDDTDGVFDRSEVIVSENIDEVPDLCGIY